jgi:hypothetical protein
MLAFYDGVVFGAFLGGDADLVGIAGFVLK